MREPELAPLKVATRDDGVVMHATSWRVRLSPSSAIRFRDRAGLWTEWIDASALYVDERGVFTDGAVRGEPARVGWRWDEVAAAEVQSLSGWRTLGGFLGTVAVSASLVPLAGASAVMTPAVALPALGGPAATTARWGGAQLVRAVASRRGDTPGTWQPELVELTARCVPHRGGAVDQGKCHRTSDATRPLFGDGAKRRAVGKLVVAADAATTLSRDRVIDGITVAARFGNLVEVGGSVRHVAGRGLEREAAWSSAPAGAFYMSGNFALDAYERVAIPLGFEVGGSSAGGYVRLRAGIRARVKDAWFVGVYPLSPTFTGTDTAPEVLPRWSFPTAIELGATF